MKKATAWLPFFLPLCVSGQVAIDEFEFYLKSATYRPANGFIDLQSAFVLVNDNLGRDMQLID